MNIPAWWKKFFQSSLEADLNIRHYTQQELLKMARDDLEASYNLLETVEDPDLVDHAIYQIKAAEKKYDYLLRQAKEQSAVSAGPAVSA